MDFKVLAVSIMFIYSVQCVPSEVAQVSLLSAQNQEENHNDDNHNVALNSKATNFNLADTYNKGARNDFSQENGAGKYDVINNNNNHHLDSSNYNDQNFKQQQGDSVSNLNKKLAHKKGHHNSGFHNSYHKDESSNKSSFYDDNDEQGGEFSQNSKNGAYGDKQSFKNGGSHSDNSFRLKGNQETGDYDNGKNYQRRVGNNNEKYNEGYYTDRENLGKVREGNRHDLANNYYQENLHHHYPQSYYEPFRYDTSRYENLPRNYNHRILFNAYDNPEKKTITIYEDPRIYHRSSDDSTYRSPGYHQDNIELNVVPPFRNRGNTNYYSARPAYDYDYY